MKDADFISSMNAMEKRAWAAFRVVKFYFLGKRKNPNYEEQVNELLDSFQSLGARM